MSVKIRNFGNDRVVHSKTELVDCLVNNYKNNSVSLQYVTQSGATCIDFIDVSLDGTVTMSYGDKHFDSTKYFFAVFFAFFCVF